VSEENVQLCRAAVAAVNEGDVGTFLKVMDPTVEFQSYLAALSEGGDLYRGHAGVRRYMRDLADAWKSFYINITEYRDQGDKVVLEGRLQARGRSSGLEVEASLAWVFTCRKGRITRVRVFTDREGALKAAGPD
jgi:ketosteroid isomerase-like protein